MRRVSARSTSRYEGPRIGFRDAEPIVKMGALTKAAVLNHWLGVRWPAGRVGSPMRFGRCTPKPNGALLFVVCVTATGTGGQVPHQRGHEDVRDVARRDVALARPVEAVRHGVVRDGAGQNRCVE